VLIAPLALILLDVLTGIWRALRTGNFSLARVSDFLSHDILKYGASFFLLVVTWLSSGQYSAATLVGTLGMGTLSLSIGSSIYNNLVALFADPVINAEEKQAIDTLTQLASTPLSALPADDRDALIASQLEPTAVMPSVRLKQQQLNADTSVIPTYSVPTVQTPPLFLRPGTTPNDSLREGMHQ
jgi:hypothetical protein